MFVYVLRAAEWKLDNPDWVGRLRLVLGRRLELRLEDKTTGQLFAKCPVEKYPGPAIEAVLDSSRYFVIRLQDDSGDYFKLLMFTGRNAFVGIGFADRSDSFDLNVALQDHFKSLAKDEQLSREMALDETKPKLDLSFKDGQTITLNIGNKSTVSRPRPRRSGANTEIPLLPPPPGVSPKLLTRSQQTPNREFTSSGLFDEHSAFLSSTSSTVANVSDRGSSSNIEVLKSTFGSSSVPASSNGSSANLVCSNILEWHYVIEGPPNTPYDGGFYYGKLVFPSEYPFKPPSIYILTPNGRFHTNTRLCLSISDFHPDTWNPGWSVGTILTGLLSFMVCTLLLYIQ
ncbi:unnamed protein product [Soboliphyme baturini]|uniref:UBC core domain-containing protein n=1 Tax=Soboliphyme baturini TaxID=241478 RepID=A0A3P8AKJ2_9BILA|nr:unnamed protein product [Soboliphyme baturini]